jgi:hypothetical protein
VISKAMVGVVGFDGLYDVVPGMFGNEHGYTVIGISHVHVEVPVLVLENRSSKLLHVGSNVGHSLVG